MPRRHHEGHLTHRIGWLRAAVLGANDGVVSTASLIVGVAAANATHAAVITAGFASLVGGRRVCLGQFAGRQRGR
jgi:VIT1/CCC1 family predicted Fe2+/Mn2+ transporter